MKLHKFLLTPPILAISAALFCGALFGATVTFTGGEDGKGTEWAVDANWDTQKQPEAGDAVVIDGKTVVAQGGFTINSLTLSGAAKLTVKANEIPATEYDKVFKDEATTLDALRKAACVVTIAGDFTVGGTAVVHPEAAILTGVPVVFKVGGDFTLAEGASFNVTKKGWGWSTGAWADKPSAYCKPRQQEGNNIQETGWTFAIGAGRGYGTGARYGGTSAGGTWNGAVYAKSYGPTFAPLFSGSPGGYYSVSDVGKCRGAGSIVILATGMAKIDGVMNANAGGKNITHDHAGASGGGIWLAAETFVFGENAKLTAEGCESSNNVYGPGGGGRIALAEGCTADDIEAMLNGTLSDDVVESSAIEDVEVSVLGGAKPNGERAVKGSVSMVRSAFVQAVLTTQSNVAGLDAAGVTWGDSVLLNGTYSFDAPEFAPLKADNGVRYWCAGFVVSNATEQIASGDGCTAEVVIDGRKGPFSLTWLWNRHEVRVSGTIVGEGTVTLCGTVYAEDFEAFVPAGEDLDLEAATEGEWKFVSWSGTAISGGFDPNRTTSFRVDAPASLGANFAFGTVRRAWIGAKNASWDVASNWSPAGLPGDDDDVCLSNATLTVGHALTLGSLTIAGSSKVTFKAEPFEGESSEANIYANATVVKTARELVIDGTAVVTAANDPVTGAAVKFDCATFCLGASATLTASEQGWFWYAGTDDQYRRFTQGGVFQTRAMGAGNSYTQGGGYGADGGNAGNGYCKAYGFAYAPFLPGSPNGLYNNVIGNGNHPGGTVWVKCAGLCELYGTVSSDGKGNTSGLSMYGAASGGGVWICAKGLKAAGTTSVTALGGYLSGSYSSHGAGGRISLALGCTDEQLDALARGEMPEGVSAVDAIELFSASARGGLKGGATPTYGMSGTVTTVTGPLGYINVTVAGSPVNALGVNPANGIEAFEGGTKQTFTAPEYGVNPNDPSVRYPCLGYVVTDANGEVKRGFERSVEVEIKDPPLAVTWQWGAAQSRTIVRKPEHGTLKLGGVAVDGDAIQWPEGVMTAVEVVPDEGYEFVCWEGNAPLGTARDNPLAAKLTEPVDVTPVLRPVAEPMTRTWKDKATGDWKTAANWEPAGIPGTNDTLVVSSGTVTFSNALTAAALDISGGTVKVGAVGNVNGEIAIAGDVRMTGGSLVLGYGVYWGFNGENKHTRYGTARMKGHARFTVGGDLTADGTASLSVFGGMIDETYTFATGTSFVDVGGALTLGGTSVLNLFGDCLTGGSVKIAAGTVTVGETAKVDALGRGYNWLDNDMPPEAKGTGYSYTAGGSHHGRGMGNSSSSVYDTPLAPKMPGSPNGVYSSGQRPGGGVIRIHAKSITLDGMLNAQAQKTSDFGGAAGGSIWITADAYQFGTNASLTVKGGGSNYGSYGAGGLVALGWKLDEERLDELADTGTWTGFRQKHAWDEAAFRAAFSNETMTINVLWGGRTAEQIAASLAQYEQTAAELKEQLKNPDLTPEEKKTLNDKLSATNTSINDTKNTQTAEKLARGTFTFVDGRIPGLMLLVK